jgi:hypothetical protein
MKDMSFEDVQQGKMKDLVHFRLSYDIIAAGFAVMYTSGVVQHLPFSHAAIDTVAKLCSRSSFLLCPPEYNTNPHSRVKLGVVELMPGRVETVRVQGDEKYALRLKLALQLNVYVDPGETDGIVDENLQAPARQCVKSQGALRISTKFADAYSEPVFQWAELWGNELRLYAVEDRTQGDTYSLSQWMAEKGDDPTSIKLTRPDESFHSQFSWLLGPTVVHFGDVRLLFDSATTADEWLAMLQDKDLLKCNPYDPPLNWKAAASLSFSVSLAVAIDTVDNHLLCMNPVGDVWDSALEVSNIGVLDCSGKQCGTGGILQALTAVNPSVIISKLLFLMQVIKPIQLWDLDSVGAGLGFKITHPVSIEETFISVGAIAEPREGETLFDAPDKLSFDARYSNLCVPEAWFDQIFTQFTEELQGENWKKMRAAFMVFAGGALLLVSCYRYLRPEPPNLW